MACCCCCSDSPPPPPPGGGVAIRSPDLAISEGCVGDVGRGPTCSSMGGDLLCICIDCIFKGVCTGLRPPDTKAVASGAVSKRGFQRNH